MTVIIEQFLDVYTPVNLDGGGITDYVIAGTLRGSWGMGSNDPLDRLAQTGEMTFDLDNSTGLFTPGGADALPGWGLGNVVTWEVRFDLAALTQGTYQKFYGAIIGISLDAGLLGPRRVHVTVADWMTYAAKFPLVNTGIQTFRRADQVVQYIAELIPPIPASLPLLTGTKLDTGSSVFPSVLDTIKTKTTAYKEFSKLAFSEVGYIYITTPKEGGNQIVFESSQHRHGWKPVDYVQKTIASSGKLLLETGDYLLLETGDKLLLDETASASYDNNMTGMEVEYGENLINRMTVFAYPKKVDTSNQVLFTLGYPLVVGSGETVTFRGNYADPVGGATVSADSSTMVTPVATTDYLFNTMQNGAGTNITANLTVTATYGTEGVTYSLTNSYADVGYVTFLQARGKGIYTYNPIEYAREDTTSIENYGYETETLHQIYQQQLYTGSVEVNKILEAERQPRIKLNKATFIANSSEMLMYSFLNLNIGSLVTIQEDQTEMNGNFYIQGIEFEVAAGGVISYTWTLKEALSLLSGLTPIAVDFAGDSTDALEFGNIPAVSNLQQRSFSCWVYWDGAPGAGTGDFIFGIQSETAGFNIYVVSSGAIYFIENEDDAGLRRTAFWSSGSGSITLGQWSHIAVVRDVSSGVDKAFTRIYIDGVYETFLWLAPVAGATLPNEDGSIVIIGNRKIAAGPYDKSFDGKIFDTRVYNKLLTQADVTALYNGGTPDATILTAPDTGLVFQAQAVRSAYLADFVDTTLDSDARVIDAVFGSVGFTHGAPIGRAAP